MEGGAGSVCRTLPPSPYIRKSAVLDPCRKVKISTIFRWSYVKKRFARVTVHALGWRHDASKKKIKELTYKRSVALGGERKQGRSYVCLLSTPREWLKHLDGII